MRAAKTTVFSRCGKELLCGVVLTFAAGWGGVLRAQVPSGTGSQTPSTVQTLPTLPPGSGTGTVDGVPYGRTTDDTMMRTGDTSGSLYDNRLREDARQRTIGQINLSEKPTEFQRLVQATTGVQLPIYGANLFGPVPSTFAPVTNVPVTPDYVIGPGDELRLQVWGQVNQQGNFTVDRTGAISVPQLGTIHVAGLRFSEVTQFLKSQFGRVYRNYDLNVNMGQLRSIQVFVVGQARRPGSYTIGSLSTLLNALFASGGVLGNGSLRDIQLRRGAERVVHFDMYDLLLRGDKSKDVVLQPGDVIFIPPAGPQVALAGSVSNPAIYELRGETTVQELLELGGGLTNVASGTTARLERVYNHSIRSMVDLDLSKASSTTLQNGDILSINAIVDRFKDAVTLRGNVANPGRYAWHEGMHVSDLIPDKNALITRNYWRKRIELGQPAPEYSPAPVTVTGETGTTGTAGVPGMPGTTGLPGTSNTIGTQGTTTVGTTGASVRTGQTEGSLQVRQPGTPTDQYGQGTPASSSNARGGSLGAALAGGNDLFGAKTDVVLSAPDIDWSYAVIERLDANELSTSLLPFNLGKIVLQNDQSQNLALLPGDVVTIFSTADVRVPISQQTRFVRLEGEFSAAGVYSVRPGETLRQLLARAGGLTPDAYLYASEFTRQSTRRAERQRLSEYADQLEAQLAAATSNASARAVSDRDTVAAQASAEEARAAIARLRRVEPVGRIVLDLKPDSRSLDEIPDLALEDGDKFVVPKVPSNVTVEGQVYSPNAFVFMRGRRVTDYLRQAGGPDRQADKKRSFVLRADGSVYSQQYGNLKHANVFPGDTIVVPPMFDRRSVLRTIVDVSTVIGQLGVGIAAINLLR